MNQGTSLQNILQTSGQTSSRASSKECLEREATALTDVLSWESDCAKDPWLQLGLKQEFLQLSVEKGIAAILHQQRCLELALLGRIGTPDDCSSKPNGLKSDYNCQEAKFHKPSSDILHDVAFDYASILRQEREQPDVWDVPSPGDIIGKSEMNSQKHRAKSRRTYDSNRLTNLGLSDEAIARRHNRVSINGAKLSRCASKAVEEEAARILKETEDLKKTKIKVKAQQRSGQSLKTTSFDPGDANRCEIIVNNKAFDFTCAAVIVFNAALIGISVEYMTKHDTEAPWIYACGHFCNVFFTMELILRLLARGCTYFYGHDSKWNWFDFVLVSFTFGDVLLLDILQLNQGGSTSQIGATLKIIKMLRIVRIFRVFRFCKELSLLALMIIDSLKSLMWALLLLSILLYVFAICFTQGSSDYLKENETSASNEDVRKHFGSLPKTLYTLVQAMLNGISWGLLSDSLITINFFLPSLFFFYITFTLLAVMNIITGVFVDNAVEMAKSEREFLVQKEMELKEKYILEMRDLFAEMDEDGSGTITEVELSEYFSDARVQSYFQALGLDPGDTSKLFALMDDDCSGNVSVDEFLDGCLRLKGAARSIDVHQAIQEIKRLQDKFEDLDINGNYSGDDQRPVNGCSAISTEIHD